MASVEFGAISADELYMLDRFDEFGGNLQLNDEVQCTVPTTVDESVRIEELAEITKVMLGREVAVGFTDVVHLMKYIVGYVEAPKPIDLPGGGVIREVVTV